MRPLKTDAAPQYIPMQPPLTGNPALEAYLLVELERIAALLAYIAKRTSP